MKEKTQSLIFLIILGVGAYFAYQYFIGPYLQGSSPATTFNMSSLPEECQGPGENLKKSFEREDIAATFNSYADNFRRCLRRAGYSDSQITEAYNGIKNSR
jgi:predicted negative regulator of RcsB-dependent stress response